MSGWNFYNEGPGVALGVYSPIGEDQGAAVRTTVHGNLECFTREELERALSRLTNTVLRQHEALGGGGSSS